MSMTLICIFHILLIHTIIDGDQQFRSMNFFVCVSSIVFNSVTPWTVANQASLSMGFFRQEYWSRLPFPPPGDLPNLGIEPTSPVAPAV